ncbi:hypothetical protein Pdw03_1214 [Penicillium digitatum]|uniref:Uncharacterized protein n=1 Tax=Penicillium digitatum TaxID=36651 RepID=A0A7T6XSA8_PENDI|nr:hypothetical protein Pdw03_1214 [Penicillium digitatum]
MRCIRRGKAVANNIRPFTARIVGTSNQILHQKYLLDRWHLEFSFAHLFFEPPPSIHLYWGFTLFVT